MVADTGLLKQIAEQKKYTFISTGMSTMQNIKDAVDIFRKKNCEFELMHCVSTYPAKNQDLNLLTIPALQKKYNTKVGYSGHENGVIISAAALIYGITSLERHITLDRTMYGSDQAASLELKGMQDLYNSIVKLMDAIGEEKVGFITEEEAIVAKKLRAHIEN